MVEPFDGTNGARRADGRRLLPSPFLPWTILPVFILLLGTVFPVTPGKATAGNGGRPEAAVDEEPSPTGKRYTYGAKFEPPAGRILHGMGQFEGGNREYLEALGDRDLHPASRLSFIALGDMPRPWEYRVKHLENFLAACRREGVMPHVSIELFGDRRTRADGRSSMEGVDHEVARTTKRDGRIRDVVRAVKRYGLPCFVRIGGEFNGEWNGYHPYRFPEAFRKVVHIFRTARVDNAAFVWCYMPAAAADFDARDPQGRYRWYPGPDVVDWFGIDLFAPEEFSTGRSDRRRAGRAEAARRTLAFLEMAERVGKPVMVAECSASRLRILPDPALGERYWNAWFGPFFRFLQDHRRSVKAFYYINTDWRRFEPYRTMGWSDARVSRNAGLMKRYRTILAGSLFLHRRDLHLLNGYDRYPPPPSRTTTEERG